MIRWKKHRRGLTNRLIRWYEHSLHAQGEKFLEMDVVRPVDSFQFSNFLNHLRTAYSGGWACELLLPPLQQTGQGHLWHRLWYPSR
ncbi:hypothetical protein M404DRAFT_1003117 [Pisolithus tinctorius Marx 270]|uniref:Uncharacterized protein n=1 Tax=Pisolithus tinctorius Marx 270 TaxID=870435 RepID=A0A0C3P1P6_PISTI|nr:hypothetical protein M404DRAFT_1003117 [Pisolithus tinctorius Marx 270]